MADTHLYLILGGARSGKSRHAEAIVEALPPPWTYIATAQAFDDEMSERIATHQAHRSDAWKTVEAPLDVPGALASVPQGQPVLVDCLTLWLTNLMLSDSEVDPAVDDLIRVLDRRHGTTVLVSNEVGLGIVPDNKLARDFRDAAGALHRVLAGKAQTVHFLMAGIPMTVKGTT